MKCLVFAGGAEKGIAYLGILKFVEEYDLIKEVECLYGTSIGSIIATLISIGYTSRELEYLILKTNIKELIPTDEFNIEKLLTTLGFIEPTRLHKLIRLLIEKKTGTQNITFKQHFSKYNKKLVITGSCISEYKCYYFSYETYPDMPIFDAIAIITCIPILFKPISFENKLFIDGAVYDNYPVYHASLSYKLSDIFGFLIIIDYTKESTIDSIDKYLLILFKSIDVKFNYLPIQLYGDITVAIQMKNPINNIYNEEIIHEFINIGYNSIKSYYDTHKDRFRQELSIILNSIDNKDILLKYNDKL